MSTIRVALDRLYRSYLEPPHLQPAIARLSGAIDSDDTALTIGNWAVADDVDLMRIGALLEIDAEIVDVLTFDDFTGACTVERGALGTTPAAHDAGSRVKLGATLPFARQSALEAVSDNILTLYPSLYQVRVVHLATVSGNVAPIEDDLAVDVIGIYDEPTDSYPILGGTIVDHHPVAAGRAVVLDGGSIGGNVWCRYRRRFGVVTSEDDTYESVGLEPSWVNIVLVGAAADLMVGQDIPESQVEWIGQALKAEAIRVGQRAGLSGALASYRQLLLERAASEMQAEYRATVGHRPVVVTRTPIY